MINKIGVQLFSVRDTMQNAEDIRMTFRKLKELGYDVAQTAGCAIPYEEFGRIAREEGIEICGTHDDFGMMVNDTEQAIKNHELLGAKIMGVGGASVGGVESCEEFIAQVNALMKKIGPMGYKFSYHNHSAEFMPLKNGKCPMEMLLEGLDPQYTSFCLDTYWVQYAGADVRHWIEKLSGRIDILHLKDMGNRPTDSWLPEPYITEIGQGNLWWQGIVEAAEKAGVRYYVVEQDSCPGDPFDSLKISSDYLHKNFMV